MAETKSSLEIEMAIALRKSQGNGFGEAKTIKVEGKRGKGKEGQVRHGIVPLEWNARNHEGFSREWSKTDLK